MKTVLVTGATSGIGLEAAVALARQGAQVTLVGRDPARTEAALQDARTRSGSADVASLLCDFSSQESIRKAAAGFRARHDRLDVLINNAGAVYAKRTLTQDGIEATFAVNHLGYFLFTQLLRDLLKPGARVVNVSSRGHLRGTLDFDDLGYERGGYQLMRAYCRSKLANVLFTRKLAKELPGVQVNALHPGGVATNIWTKAPRWAQPILNLARLFMLTPAQGAETIVWLASSPEATGSGGYYVKKKPAPISKLAQDDALADRLWAESERLTAPRTPRA